MNCVHGKTIYTGKRVVKDAYLVINGRTIAAVSKTRRGKLLGQFSVLTPAFIDPHNHIGIHRSGEPVAENETNDHMDSILVLPDVLDSIQMDDDAFGQAVAMGVLYSCVLPGSSNIIGGSSAVIRNYAQNSNQALVARAGVKAAFGYNLMAARERKGTRPSTRMGALAVLRARLDAVQQKMETFRRSSATRRRQMTFSTEEAVLRDILKGKTRLRAHAHKTDDIAALLRIVDQYKLTVTVEHAMDVHDPTIFRELKKRKIPVDYGPVDSFASKVELKHKHWRNIPLLVESGVDLALMTDHPVVPTWQILLQTRHFMRAGLSKQDAIELVSRRNAEILGIHRILGTLDKGKWASFIGWNGDPFSLTSYPVSVYGEGKLLSAE
jgi:imidazolonepropionase-like amidohydrolase